MSSGIKGVLAAGALIYLAAGFWFQAIPSHECTSEQRAADPDFCDPGLGQRVAEIVLWPLNRSDEDRHDLPEPNGPRSFPVRKKGMSDEDWTKTIDRWCGEIAATKPENIDHYEKNCLELPLARTSNAETAKLPALPEIAVDPTKTPPSRAPDTSHADWSRTVGAWCRANSAMADVEPKDASGRAKLFYDLNCAASPPTNGGGYAAPAENTAATTLQIGSDFEAGRIHFPIRQEDESQERWHDRIGNWCVLHGRRPKDLYAPQGGGATSATVPVTAGQGEAPQTSGGSLLTQLPDMDLDLEPPVVRIEDLEIVEKYKKAYCQPR